LTRPLRRPAPKGTSDAPVRLISAPGVVRQMGPRAVVELIRAVRTERPAAAVDAVLDCGDAPGLALNALRHGAEAVRLDAPAPVLNKVRAIAAETGARVEGCEP
jgi:hypothetical protein